MSFNTSTSNKSRADCVLCRNANVDIALRNHFPKTEPGPKGKPNILCPTIASLSCKYCKESYHTIKHCPLIAEKNRMLSISSKEERRHNYNENKTKAIRQLATKTKTNMNLFLELDEEEEQEVIDAFPPILVQDTKKRALSPSTPQPEMKSYKTVLEAKPLPKVVEVFVTKPTFVEAANNKNKSWADDDEWLSSDEEDDYCFTKGRMTIDELNCDEEW